MDILIGSRISWFSFAFPNNEPYLFFPKIINFIYWFKETFIFKLFGTVLECYPKSS